MINLMIYLCLCWFCCDSEHLCLAMVQFMNFHWFGAIHFYIGGNNSGIFISILNSEFRCRRITWWVWRVSLLVPYIVTDVLYMMRVNYDIYFAWQAQYLMVKLEGDSCFSAYSKWKLTCFLKINGRKMRCPIEMVLLLGGAFLHFRGQSICWCFLCRKFHASHSRRVYLELDV